MNAQSPGPAVTSRPSRVPVDPAHPEFGRLLHAANIIRHGGLVAYPTETFYGLGVLPSRAEALDRLWRLKAREGGGPFLLLVPSAEGAAAVVRPEALRAVAFRALAERFWPGPLTLVLDGREGLDRRLLGADGGVAIRVSSHPVASRLVRVLGEPLTSTSANLRGMPPARSPEEIRASGLDASLDLVVCGGETAGGRPSTVLRLIADRAVVLREGAVSREEIALCLAGCSIRVS